jgi:hypothetical protein
MQPSFENGKSYKLHVKQSKGALPLVIPPRIINKMLHLQQIQETQIQTMIHHS